MVDIFNITRNNELWTDTSDGTHVGWKANAIKVDRLIRVRDSPETNVDVMTAKLSDTIAFLVLIACTTCVVRRSRTQGISMTSAAPMYQAVLATDTKNCNRILARTDDCVNRVQFFERINKLG